MAVITAGSRITLMMPISAPHVEQASGATS